MVKPGPINIKIKTGLWLTLKTSAEARDANDYLKKHSTNVPSASIIKLENAVAIYWKLIILTVILTITRKTI